MNTDQSVPSLRTEEARKLIEKWRGADDGFCGCLSCCDTRAFRQQCADELAALLASSAPREEADEELAFLRTRDAHADDVIRKRNLRLSELAAENDALRQRITVLETSVDHLRYLVDHPVKQDWQPIETAPKDGTEILLTDGNWKRTGYWAKRAEVWAMDAAVSLPMATHWAPLPLAARLPPQENA